MTKPHYHLNRGQQKRFQQYLASRNGVDDYANAPLYYEANELFPWEEDRAECDCMRNWSNYDFYEWRLEQVRHLIGKKLKQRYHALSHIPYLADGERAHRVTADELHELFQLYQGDIFENGLLGVIIASIENLDQFDTLVYSSEYGISEGQIDDYLMFSPFWLRRPSSWRPESGVSLIDHLFVKYPVPVQYYQAWTGTGWNNHWRFWFIMLGQGISVTYVATKLAWPLSKRLLHTVNNLPLHVQQSTDPVLAVIYAQILIMGGNETDFIRVTNNGGYVIDLTEAPQRNRHFHERDIYQQQHDWHDSVRWMIQYSAEMTDEQAQLILDWVLHERIERYREIIRELPEGSTVDISNQPNWFYMRGRALRNVLVSANEYHERINRVKLRENLNWDAHGLDWCIIGTNDQRVEFIELTCSQQLQQEGRALQHCVGGYDYKCYRGDLSIVGMRINGVRTITIEISILRKGSIAQMRGRQNRNASSYEQALVNTWLVNLVDNKWDKNESLPG